MGRNEFRNLILMAREDHNSDSPNYRPGGEKVHFDLRGYDILFWNPNRLNDFEAELRKRIQGRLQLLSSSTGGLRAEKSRENRRQK